MYKLVSGALLAIGWFWSIPASAAVSLTEWGASAGTASADCSILNCTQMDFLLFNPIIPGTVAGGLHQVSAEILDDVNPDGRGTASASVQISGGGLNVPVLRARAASVDGNGWVSGTAIGIQGYQFTGVDGTTVTLDSSLTGNVNNTSGSDVTGLSVGIWLMRNDPVFTFPTVPGSLSDLLLQIALLPTEDSFSWDALASGPVNRDTTTTDPGDQLQITLNNGDEFYLLAGLTAGADGTGAFADSFSTLQMAFDTTDLLVASVPLPAAVWLLGSAMIGLMGLGRQRATSRDRIREG